MKAEQVFRFDTKGKALKGRKPVAKSAKPKTTPADHLSSHDSNPSTIHDGHASAAKGELLTNGAHERELPIWFVAAASVLNLLVAIGLGWFLSRKQIPEALQAWLDQQEPEAASAP